MEPCISYIFEDGDLGKGKLITALNDVVKRPLKALPFRFARFGFGTKKLPPLQAADWYAYDHRLFAKREALPQLTKESRADDHPRRKSFEALRRIPCEVRPFWTRDAILNIVRGAFVLDEVEREAAAIIAARDK
jgi:hypothetical protein